MFPGLTEVHTFWAGNPGASHSSPTLGETKVSSISLPDLVNVEGSFQISGAPRLYNLDLPKLKVVNGIFSISGTQMSSISLPSLEFINGGPAYFTGSFDEYVLSMYSSSFRVFETTYLYKMCADYNFQT